MSTFIVSDTIGKEVVYSATCYENNTSEGPQTWLQISKIEGPEGIASTELVVALGAPGAPGGILDILDGALKIVGGALAIGAVIVSAPWSLGLAVLAAAGGLAAATVSFFNKKGDPVALKFEELKNQLHKLDEKIMARFEDLKAFITESKFNEEIIAEVMTLRMLLTDVFVEDNKMAISNFAEVYEQTPPLILAYKLMAFLSQKSTNPFLMETNHLEGGNDRAIEKWKNIIRTIIGDLVFIEGIASGLLKEKNLHDGERLVELADEITEMFRGWHDLNYTNKLKKHLEPWLNEKDELTNAQRADEIKKELEIYQLKTGNLWHYFYVVVFNHFRGVDQYWDDVKFPNQTIRSYSGQGKNVFIYWSKWAMGLSGQSKPTEEECETFKTKVQSYKNRYYKDKIIEELEARPIPNAGFTIVMGGLDEEVRQANYSHEEGPGWWTNSFNFGGPHERRIIAGFW